jgi:hypothetical protein
MPDVIDTRRSVYLILIAVTVAIAAAKVFGAENVLEPSRYKAPDGKAGVKVYGSELYREWPTERPDPSPMFSSNDKSRWATVRCLVDEGTYAIGKRTFPDGKDPTVFKDEGVVTEPQFKSLDIVLRPLGSEANGPQTRSFYSSKPPLFPTLIAGEYWLLKRVFGWDIVRDRWLVIPTIVFTLNVIPFAIYLMLIAQLIEVMGNSDFGRLLAFCVACFGTYLITFTVTLNNHLPAAFCVLLAAFPLIRAITEKRDMRPSGYIACGFFAAFAVTFDLPAAAFLAALGIPLFIVRTRSTLLYFLPSAAVPIAALLVCNFIAMGQILPAYSEFGGPWYNFVGSHWAKRGTPLARGIDFNDEPTRVYAFHLLFGHHGWFSLTPVWLLSLGGLLVMGIRSAADVRKLLSRGTGTGWTHELFAGMTLVVSVVVFTFYLTRTQSYNYGGFTSGPRWLFWLIPLWILGLPFAADRVGSSRAGRLLSVVLLGFSVFSVFYPVPNPWRAPWILQLMEFTGYLHY